MKDGAIQHHRMGRFDGPLGNFALELLEPRRVFSGPVITLSFVDGIVSIRGTEGRDLVNIQQLPNWNGNPTIVVIYQSYSHGSDGGFGIAGGVGYFNRSAVKEIHFDGGGGDDIAYCQNKVSADDLPVEDVDVPLLLKGGDGDDSLLGGKGDDTIIGGAGKDWIDGGAFDNSYDLIFSYWTGSDNGLTKQRFASDATGNMLGINAGNDTLIADLQASDATAGVIASGTPATTPPASDPATNIPSAPTPTVPDAPGAGSISGFFADQDKSKELLS